MGETKATDEATDFVRAVAKAVRAVPKGRVASYGQVAEWAGKPGAARAVVRALYRTQGLPWWRIIRSDGTLAPEVAREQAARLRAEGIDIKGRKVIGAARQQSAARAPAKPTRGSNRSSSPPRKR